MAPAPELHAEIFGSPATRRRIPGISILTPGKGRPTPRREVARSEDEGRDDIDHGYRGRSGKERERDPWDSDDSDSEEGFGGGMSPPKTMQFYVPQTRLLRTPAREASKRIVEDLLLTAGGNVTDELDDEDSPSVVKRGGLDEDDTF
ncbi:MAG: hypothetical protein Q9190_006343 [Brigantiaea leucoxantha]